MNTPSILIYGHDATLLNTRRWVLEKVGYEVVTTSGIEDAERVILSRQVGLIILCHTLTSAERCAALATADAVRPQMPKLFLCAISRTGLDQEAESLLDSMAGPAALISAVRNLLQ